MFLEARRAGDGRATRWPDGVVRGLCACDGVRQFGGAGEGGAGLAAVILRRFVSLRQTGRPAWPPWPQRLKLHRHLELYLSLHSFYCYETEKKEENMSDEPPAPTAVNWALEASKAPK